MSRTRRDARDSVSASIIARCLLRRRLRLISESKEDTRGRETIEGHRPDTGSTSETDDDLRVLDLNQVSESCND